MLQRPSLLHGPVLLLVLVVGAILAGVYAQLGLATLFSTSALFFPAFVLGSLYALFAQIRQVSIHPAGSAIAGALTAALGALIVAYLRLNNYAAATGNLLNDAGMLAVQLAIIGAVSGGVAGYITRRT